jgi:hypothetical protein
MPMALWISSGVDFLISKFLIRERESAEPGLGLPRLRARIARGGGCTFLATRVQCRSLPVPGIGVPDHVLRDHLVSYWFLRGTSHYGRRLSGQGILAI